MMHKVRTVNPAQLELFGAEVNLFPVAGETKEFGENDLRQFDAQKHRWVNADGQEIERPNVNERSTYDKIVNANLRFMGTSKSDWKALPIDTFSEVETGRGDSKLMPIFDFSGMDGYKTAPSLYKNEGVDTCCELCGHKIKEVYHLKNDSKKWKLIVGSECVTHFGTGDSGKKLTEKKKVSEGAELNEKLYEVSGKLSEIIKGIPDYGRGMNIYLHSLYSRLHLMTVQDGEDKKSYETQLKRLLRKKDDAEHLIQQGLDAINKNPRPIEGSGFISIVSFRNGSLQCRVKYNKNKFRYFCIDQKPYPNSDEYELDDYFTNWREYINKIIP